MKKKYDGWVWFFCLIATITSFAVKYITFKVIRVEKFGQI